MLLKSMKRGQIHSHIFIYIFILLLVIVILVFGFVMIKKSGKTAEKAQLRNAALSLKNFVDEYNKLEAGSKEISFSLPTDVKKVCIVSGEAEGMDFVFQGSGIYFLPGNFYEIKGFSIENGFVCSDVLGKIGLELIKEEDVIIKITESEQECKSVKYNKENNIDIVFLNHNLNGADFSEKVNEYVETLSSKEPLKSGEEKFNFYLVDENVECETENFIICDDINAKRVASGCPNDYIIILSKHLLDVPRSSAKGRVMAINTADDNLVVLHEFGHAFGNLADEYVVEGLNEIDAVNCQESPAWETKYTGCSVESYYRSSDDSIMRSFGPFSTNEFNEISKNELLKKMGVYK